MVMDETHDDGGEVYVVPALLGRVLLGNLFKVGLKV